MASLLGALLRNESGGRNIANTNQGTSSGQAQGYFQITTGTWDDFGGRKYAANPMQASYEQQAEIASKIPLKRWDASTLAVMRATGKPIDPNRTLGENLAMHGENFAGGAKDGGAPPSPYAGMADGQKGQEAYASPNQYALPATPYTPPDGPKGQEMYPAPAAAAPAKKPSFWAKLAKGIGKADLPGTIAPAGGGVGPAPEAARIDQPEVPFISPQGNEQQRQQLAMAMQRLNSGRLF